MTPCVLLAATIALAAAVALAGCSQDVSSSPAPPSVPPRTFDDAAMVSVELPLAVADATPVQMSSETYYRIPIAPIYKSYPVYAPDREPPGYFASLQDRAPEVAFDPAALPTNADWIRAGELVFDAPIGFGSFLGPRPDVYVRDPRWLQHVRPPIATDGTLPFYRYVIREKGKVEIGVLSCGMCHTRVLPDGSVIKGAQGNFPLHRAVADDFAGAPDVASVRRGERMLFSAPWLTPDAYPDLDRRSLKEIVALHEAIPPGVLARHGTSPLVPVKVPDLIGVRDRRYLDATGLEQHRDIGDLMRYAAKNQTTISWLAIVTSSRPNRCSAPWPATRCSSSSSQAADATATSNSTRWPSTSMP